MKLRGGFTTEDARLDRLPSQTSEHIVKFPLTAQTMPSQATSMVAGINWYSNFSSPVKMREGRWPVYWIGTGGLGRVLGGHAVCLRHNDIKDNLLWWPYMNQGLEGRCVEFACHRERMHANRKRYDKTSRWLYWRAQQIDEWTGGSYPGADPSYEGTSVRAGLAVEQTEGLVVARRLGLHVSEPKPVIEEGPATYRWALNWDDVRIALGVPADQPGVPLNNSWGTYYPREVRLTDEAGERVLREDGEFGIVTDK